jgi:hypothetical protein
LDVLMRTSLPYHARLRDSAAQQPFGQTPESFAFTYIVGRRRKWLERDFGRRQLNDCEVHFVRHAAAAADRRRIEDGDFGDAALRYISR